MLQNLASITLYIDVAERSTKSGHGTCNGNAHRLVYAQLKKILESCVATYWVVVERDGASNGVLPVLQVLVLPDPPYTIDLCVVQEKVWVAVEHVSTW